VNLQVVSVTLVLQNGCNMSTIERIEAPKGEFVHTAVEWLVKMINHFITADGECIIGLSGGMWILAFSASSNLHSMLLPLVQHLHN